MLSFRRTKHHGSPLVLFKVSFTDSQEAELKNLLTGSPEILSSMKADWFDNNGQYVSKHDSVVQTLLTTVKSKNNVLFPRDRYSKINTDGSYIYESVISREAAKHIAPLVELMEQVGMKLALDKPGK